MNWDALSWEAKRGAVLAQALFVCEMCGHESATEVDHIFPKSKGGSDERSNLRAACRPCNRGKGDAVHYSDLDADPSLLIDPWFHELGVARQAIATAARWLTFRRLIGEHGLSARDADEWTQAPPGLEDEDTDFVFQEVVREAGANVDRWVATQYPTVTEVDR